MAEAVYLYHPMIARAMTAYRCGQNYSDGISRQLSALIGMIPSTSAREAELRNIYAAVQSTELPHKFAPALQELSLQIVRLLGGIAQLKAVSPIQRV